MNTFDEAKIKRDGSGQFAEKPAAAEADGVELDEGAENFEPGVLGAKESRSHQESAAALESVEEKLQAQLRAVQDQRLRHTIAAAVAGADAEYPGGKTIQVFDDGDEVDDYGGHTVSLGEVYDVDGETLHDFGGEVQWSSTMGTSSGEGWQRDFTSDRYGETIDMDKVRAWSVDSDQVSETIATWDAANAMSEQARGACMRKAGDLARTHVPNARYLVAGETDDPDTITFTELQDAEGNTLHEMYGDEHPGVPQGFDDDLDSYVRGAGATGRGWEHAVVQEGSTSYEGYYDLARIDLDKLGGKA